MFSYRIIYGSFGNECVSVESFEEFKFGKTGRRVLVGVDADLGISINGEIKFDINGTVDVELKIEEIVRHYAVVDCVAYFRE
jgi:hypothetical protein